MSDSCTHLDGLADAEPSGQGCARCLATGGRWVHLRVCMTCGEVGCRDSTPSRHASAHCSEQGHPVGQSFEPEDDWWWCYEKELSFTVTDRPTLGYA